MFEFPQCSLHDGHVRQLAGRSCVRVTHLARLGLANPHCSAAETADLHVRSRASAAQVPVSGSTPAVSSAPRWLQVASKARALRVVGFVMRAGKQDLVDVAERSSLRIQVRVVKCAGGWLRNGSDGMKKPRLRGAFFFLKQPWQTRVRLRSSPGNLDYSAATADPRIVVTSAGISSGE